MMLALVTNSVLVLLHSNKKQLVPALVSLMSAQLCVVQQLAKARRVFAASSLASQRANFGIWPRGTLL